MHNGNLEAHSPEFISPPLLIVKLRDEDVAGCLGWLCSATAVLRNPCRNQSGVLLWEAAALLCPGVSFLQLMINSLGLSMSQESKKLSSHLNAAQQKASLSPGSWREGSRFAIVHPTRVRRDCSFAMAIHVCMRNSLRRVIIEERVS